MSEYASYITNLKGKTNITATQDIVTEKGVLLAKAGTTFSDKTYASILNFKLLKPLEDSIFLENQLTPELIYTQLIDRVNQDPSLSAINDDLVNKTVLKQCCAALAKFPILLQKLTVLDMELTDIFFQSLLSAYLAHLAARIEQQPQSVVEEYFIAGIFHDIGLLHIDRYILTKKERLTADEWRKVQSHPIIGCQIVKNLANFPKISARAILEHHENADGSGYPRSKKRAELCHLGQLLSLLDNVIVIYNKKLKPFKRTMYDLRPILKISMHSYFPDVVSAVFKLLNNVPPSEIQEHKLSILNELIDYVVALKHYASTLEHEITHANKDVGLKHGDEKIYAIQSVGQDISFIMSSAGFTDDNDDLGWNEELKDKDHQAQLYREVDNTRLLIDELIYISNSYQKSANVYTNQNPDSPFTPRLTEALKAFDSTPKPQPSEKLTAFWKDLSA